VFALRRSIGFGRFRLAFTLGLNFHAADSRLDFQQLQLRVVQFLAGRSIALKRDCFATILRDQLQTQALFQDFDLQLSPLQLFAELFNLLGFGKRRRGHAAL
jgi:hypothetical protein